MSQSMNSRRKKVLFAAVAAMASMPALSRAATVTWTGNAGPNWNLAGNWDALPVANDVLQFTGNNNLINNNDFAASTQYNGINFLSGAGAFNLGGNAVVLGGDINQSSANNQTIALPLFLEGATSNVNVTGAGTLSLGQVAYGAAAGNANASTLNINNSVSTTSLLVRTNSATANMLGIAAGQTLTVNGEFSAGVPATALGSVLTSLTTTGSGSLVVNGGASLFRVGMSRPNTGAGTDPFTVVNLSSLDSFTFSGTNHFRVGNGNSRGELNLAANSNSITTNILRVGDSGQDAGGTGGSDNNNGGTGILRLGGGTNVINADTLQIGRTKSAGIIQFQGGTGSLTIAGTAGGASTANITLGSADNGTGANTTSELQFAGHNVTVQAGTVILGQMTANGVQSGRGSVTFDTGTFSATNLRMGVNGGTGASAVAAQGSFTLGGTGVLNVTSQFFLAQRTTATAAGSIATGTFTMNGGTANVFTDILDASTTVSTLGPNVTTMTLAGGTLNLNGKQIGTAAAPITTVNMPAAAQTVTISDLGGTGITATNLGGLGGLNHNGGGTVILAGTNTYTGDTGIGAGGTLRVTGTLPGATNIANDGLLDLANTANQTISGNITNSGAVTQSGTGTSTLGGANTYSGATNIDAGGITVTGSLNAAGAVNVNTSGTSAGTLSGNGSLGNVTVAANNGSNIASIKPGASTADGSIGTLSAASLSANGGNYRVDATGAGDSIAVSGAATYNAASTITVAPGASAGTYNIVTAGTLSGTAPTLTAAGAGRSTFGLNFDTTNNLIQLSVTGGPLSLTWTGAVNGVWDVTPTGGPPGTANWNNGGGPDTFYDFDTVTFATGGANHNITLNAIATPTAVNFTHTNSYTINGTGGIAGLGSLSLTGGGSVTLGTVNTYGGATNVTNGTLNLGGTGSIASTAVNVGAAGVLNVNGANGLSAGANLANSGTVNLNASQAISTLNGAGSLAVTTGTLSVSGGGAYSGVISGAGALNNTGGTLVLTNANTYGGGTTVSGGTLQLGDGTTAGSITGAVTVTTPGVLAYNLPASATSSTNISGTGGVAQLAANTLTLNGTLSYSGVGSIAAGGTIQYTGASSKTVGGYNGGGSVIVGDGANATTVNAVGSGGYTGTTTINAGSTLVVSTLANAGSNSSIGAANNGPADLLIDNGTLRWVGGANQTSNRGMTIGATGATLDSSPTAGAVQLTLNGTSALGYTDGSARTLTFTGTDLTPLQIATNAFNLVINDPGSPLSIVKNGNNRWQLGGANTYTGGTQVNAGQVRAANPSAFGGGAVNVANGAQVYLNVAGAFNNNFNIAGIGPAEAPGVELPGNYGALRIANVGSQVNGTVTLTADARITGRSAGTGGSINGQITGPFNLEFGNSGGGIGTVIITHGGNNWTGNTIISSGTLKTGGSEVIPNGPGFGNVVMNGNGGTTGALTTTFDLQGNSETINGLSSTGNAALLTVGTVTGGNLSVGDNNTTATYAGTVGGALGITKIGAGTQTLTGPLTYNGTTNVSAGTLAMQANHTASSGISVTGGTLELPSNGSNMRVIRTNSVSVTGGKIDLADNKMIVNGGAGGSFWDGTKYTGVAGLVQDGYNGGDWGGVGIVTTQSNAISPNVLTALVTMSSDDAGLAGGSFGGQNVVSNDQLIMYTWGGDANMDGTLNGDDYFQIDSNIALAGTVFGYRNGDFNYDGDINGDDYFIIDSNINVAQNATPFPVASDVGGVAGLTAVPEPASLSVLAIAACGLRRAQSSRLASRRRRSAKN